MSNYNSIAEVDAAYPEAATVGYAQQLMDLTGPVIYRDAWAEVLEREAVCGIPRHEAARLVLTDYKAGAR